MSITEEKLRRWKKKGLSISHTGVGDSWTLEGYPNPLTEKDCEDIVKALDVVDEYLSVTSNNIEWNGK